MSYRFKILRVLYQRIVAPQVWLGRQLERHLVQVARDHPDGRYQVDGWAVLWAQIGQVMEKYFSDTVTTDVFQLIFQIFLNLSKFTVKSEVNQCLNIVNVFPQSFYFIYQVVDPGFNLRVF